MWRHLSGFFFLVTSMMYNSVKKKQKKKQENCGRFVKQAKRQSFFPLSFGHSERCLGQRLPCP